MHEASTSIDVQPAVPILLSAVARQDGGTVMSSGTEEFVNPARVDALSRRINAIEEDFQEEIAELRTENRDLRTKVEKMEKKMEMIGADEIEPSTPDKRALKIREWLYREANKSEHGKASLDKNSAKGVIGNLQRTQIYEAMRRAADGNSGAKNGSSKLSAKRGFEFEKFGANDDRNTRVTLSLEKAQEDITSRMMDVTANEGR